MTRIEQGNPEKERVFEIGAGEEFGPPFPGADYIVTDPDLKALERSREALLEAGCAAVAVSATQLPTYCRSVNTIVARNVFGDPLLVMPERKAARSSLFDLLQQGEHEEYSRLDRELRAESYGLKDGIIKEAARVLITGGKLIAVEHKTPWVAAEYLEGSGSQVAAAVGLDVAKVALQEVVPSTYAEPFKENPLLEAWTLTRI